MSTETQTKLFCYIQSRDVTMRGWHWTETFSVKLNHFFDWKKHVLNAEIKGKIKKS